MKKLIYQKLRFETLNARDLQVLTLMFFLLGVLQLTPAQERSVSSAPILEQQVAMYPDSLALRHRLVHGYIQSSAWAKAEKQLRAIIALAPTRFAAYNNLGNVFLLQDKLDSAAANYAKALSLAATADDSLGIQFNLTALLFAAGADTFAPAMRVEAVRYNRDIKRTENPRGIALRPEELFFSDQAANVAEGRGASFASGKGTKKGNKDKGKKTTKGGGQQSRVETPEKEWAAGTETSKMPEEKPAPGAEKPAAKPKKVKAAGMPGGESVWPTHPHVSMETPDAAPPVKIEAINILPIYASLYKRHSKDSIGTAVIRYKGPEPFNYRLSVSISRYALVNLQQYFVTPNVVARPNQGELKKVEAETVEIVPLYAIFTDSILAVDENTPLQASVTVSYSVNRKAHSARANREFQIFPRNRLNWAGGAEQVAAFIDPEDNDIKAAANDFLARVPAEVPINSNLGRAQKLFEGLGLAGVSYKEDPAQPFRQAYTGLDNVLYPYQLLQENKTGDCDDLTVLYAALLESCNIPSALISVPGHLFLMLDSGIPERLHDMMKLPRFMYHVFEGNVWIPLEMTEVGKSFDAAWERGAKNFQRYTAAGDAQIVKVRAAWQKYEPVQYPRRLKRGHGPLLHAANGSFVRQIRQHQEKYLDSLKQQLAQNPIAARNRLARIAAFEGNYAEAQRYLREVIALDPKNFTAHNNLGNVYFLQANLDSTARHYFQAQPLAKNADDSLGIRLNLGAYHHAVHDDASAVETVAEVFNGRNDLVRIERLLGLNFAEIDLRKAGPEQLQNISAFSMKHIVLQARDAKPAKTGQKPPRKTTKPAGQKGKAPSPDRINNVFFWAQ